ncbi:hypothetical protein EDB84DRAFT_1556027 [Lactarius hengduanensis]|nr:hypothetical protein EDB84DRAFT_1556027 [Lactarius hengduanensis]
MDPTTSFNGKMLRRQIELNISKNEILLVKLPDQPAVTSNEVGDPVVSDRESSSKAHTKGKFTEDDIELNDIVDADDGGSRICQKVYRNKRHFAFAKLGCIKFALELYNLCSALADESEKGDTGTNVKKLATGVNKMNKRTGDDGGNQPGRNIRQKGGDRGATEQLEARGYVLPPHVRTVYQQCDPNKTELIAKHLHEGSNEFDILEYLHTIQPQSPHVISLIEIIPSITGGWLILPKLHSIRDQ